MPPSFPHQHQHQQHDPCSADEEKRAADAEVRWGQLVAFCSTDTAFVVSVHPETRVLFKLRRPKSHTIILRTPYAIPGRPRLAGHYRF
eukprot:3939143-Rhodomonas_salina.14